MEAGMNGGLATFALPQPVKDVLLLPALAVSILAVVVAWNNYRPTPPALTACAPTSRSPAPATHGGRRSTA